MDRLSALPDDLLIQILLKLSDTAAAAQTSVLSTRWRRLWTLLPQLYFGSRTNPLAIRSVLQVPEAPPLDLIAVGLQADSVAAWLAIAPRRLAGTLCLLNQAEAPPNEDLRPLELPCFNNATTIYLQLGYLGLALPPSGVFAALTDLFLYHIKLHGLLGDLVSSPRCPALRRLAIHDAWGLGNLAIHSDSLLEILLLDLHSSLQHLTLVAPSLEVLDVRSSFAKRGQPGANISAPQLLSLYWIDHYDPIFMQLGKMETLQLLHASPYFVYGGQDDGYTLQCNRSCVSLLHHFRLIPALGLILLYLSKDITDYDYMVELMEDIQSFPNITNLSLNLRAKGHSCGATLYLVLRMCTGVTELDLELTDESGSPEAETVCPSGCVCDEPPNWKTSELVLDRLKEIKFSELRGTENEAGLVKRLFEWATVLETMTITFDCSVAESKAREFCQMLRSFSRPEICLKGAHFA